MRYTPSFEPDSLERVPVSSSAGNRPNTAKTKIIILMLSLSATRIATPFPAPLGSAKPGAELRRARGELHHHRRSSREPLGARHTVARWGLAPAGDNVGRFQVAPGGRVGRATVAPGAPGGRAGVPGGFDGVLP